MLEEGHVLFIMFEFTARGLEARPTLMSSSSGDHPSMFYTRTMKSPRAHSCRWRSGVSEAVPDSALDESRGFQDPVRAPRRGESPLELTYEHDMTRAARSRSGLWVEVTGCSRRCLRPRPAPGERWCDFLIRGKQSGRVDDPFFVVSRTGLMFQIVTKYMCDA